MISLLRLLLVSTVGAAISRGQLLMTVANASAKSRFRDAELPSPGPQADLDEHRDVPAACPGRRRRPV